MYILKDEIEEATRTTNGATIAGYCAQKPDGKLGAIWILSERGKVSHTIPGPITGNTTWTTYNCCDLPALMWLTRQKRPCVWVSDGHVNGFNGEHSKEITDVCYGVVRRFGIKRLGNLEELAEYLENM
jgi:hypothetical protein